MAEDDLVRVRVGGVSVAVPTAAVRRDEAGIDSQAAVFEGGGLSILVDQGPFAPGLETDVGRPGFREDVRAVGSGTGRVVSYRDPDAGTYTVAVHLAGPRRATVVVRADATVPEQVPLQIVESVEIVD